jgi:hypothetical protein
MVYPLMTQRGHSSERLSKCHVSDAPAAAPTRQGFDQLGRTISDSPPGRKVLGLSQEAQPLRPHQCAKESNARSVATRPVEARDEAHLS